MGDRIRAAGAVAWGLLGLAGVLAIAIFLAWLVRIVWPPLILAGAIAFLLNPVVTRLARRGVPRPLGTAVAYLGVIGTVVVLALLITPLAVNQYGQLRDDLPAIERRVDRFIDERAAASKGTFYEFSRSDLQSAIGTGGDSSLSQQLDQVAAIGRQVFHVLLVLVLGPILAFYLLVDLPRLRRVAASLVPSRFEPEALAIGRRLNAAIGGFFRGQLAVALIVGVMVSIGLGIIGLRFWFLVGMIAGLFNVIPLIGPFIGGVPGVVIALTTGSPLQALLVVVVMVAAQQIDNHFITPQVMQRAVHLHPAVVVLALLVGGDLLGFLGLLIAVPAAAALKIVVGHLWRVYVLGQPFDPERVAAADEGGPEAVPA